MDFITNAVTLAVTGTIIAVSSMFGFNLDTQTDMPQQNTTQNVVCGSAGLLPEDVEPC